VDNSEEEGEIWTAIHVVAILINVKRLCFTFQALSVMIFDFHKSDVFRVPFYVFAEWA